MAIGYAEKAEAGGSGVGGQLRIHLLGQPGDLQVKVLAMLTSTTTPLAHVHLLTHHSMIMINKSFFKRDGQRELYLRVSKLEGSFFCL